MPSFVALMPLPLVPQMRGDIGTYKISDLAQSILDDEGMLWLLQNAFRPDTECCFPFSRRVWKKAIAWLRQFSWLSYSPCVCGGYCIVCVLFAKKSW